LVRQTPDKRLSGQHRQTEPNSSFLGVFEGLCPNINLLLWASTGHGHTLGPIVDFVPTPTIPWLNYIHLLRPLTYFLLQGTTPHLSPFYGGSNFKICKIGDVTTHIITSFFFRQDVGTFWRLSTVTSIALHQFPFKDILQKSDTALCISPCNTQYKSIQICAT
jgi:hypothetical protein